MAIISALNSTLLAISAADRFNSIQKLDSDKSTALWITITCLVAIGLFKFLFMLKKWIEESKNAPSKQLFFKIADEKKLNHREIKMLQDIIKSININQKESIFSLSSAFDRGAAKLVEEHLALRGIEEANYLRTELAFLRQKLGFVKQHPASIATMMKSNKLSSRQIAVGEKIQIECREVKNPEVIEAVVIENENKKFVIESQKPIKSRPGDLWYGRYYFGASIWEFEVFAADDGGKTLALEHSDSIRFVNRRRFPRIPVNKPAFVGCVPLGRTINEDTNDHAEDAQDSNWGCRQLTQAVITELAGPGLRINVPMELKEGDRLMVVFEVEEEGSGNSTYQTTDSKKSKSVIIEDVGVVRNIRAIENGWSAAVELVGLSNTDLNTLIHATNAASLQTERQEDTTPSENLLARVQASNKIAEDIRLGC